MPKAHSAITSVLVVPCYDEAQRFQSQDFTRALDENPQLGLILVDDGSRDETLKVLESFARRHPAQVFVHPLRSNRGKAEAVREGFMLHFQEIPELPWARSNLRHMGYWDADLATPFSEFPRFLEIFAQNPALELVMGARVNLLGRAIKRKAHRHYLGRVFATAASFVLKLPVYDTQCGAKVFRYQPELIKLFDKPFISGWIFDVELLARMTQEAKHQDALSMIYELPLLRWHDVAGSKIRARDFLKATLSLIRIAQLYPPNPQTEKGA